MHLAKEVSLNLNVRGLQQSATLRINDRSKRLQSSGNTVYRLGLGQSPFPIPSQVVEALKSHAHEKDYLPSMGHPQLREAVADYHRRIDGVDATGENVLVGPGSKELMFLVQLTYYGELWAPTPCWVSYTPQAKIIGRNVTLISARAGDRWRITAERLEERCARQQDQYRPRILILNYPGNPDGCSYTAQELKEIADVARKYRIIILSDEIYGPLHHKGEHISISRFYPEQTIISSGLSKWCGAGGWRIGTFTFPPELDWLQSAMATVASETYTSVSAPIQCAAVRAFQGSSRIERYLQHVRRILSTLGNEIAGMLNDGGIHVNPPTGAFYLFLDFEGLRDNLARRGIVNSSQLTEQLLKDTGVALLPGEDFERPCEELTARLAYVDFDGAKALTASELTPLDKPLPENFTELYCYNVLKACRLIVDWANR